MQSLIFRLLVLSLAGLDPMLLAQSQGTFTATGNMTTGRYGHTATLLNYGRGFRCENPESASKIPISHSYVVIPNSFSTNFI